MSRFETRRAAKLRELAQCGPLVAASLCEVDRRCGKPSCACTRGQPHRAHVLSYKVKGKTRLVHVPKDLVPEVQTWVQEYRRVKGLLRDISRQSLAIIRRHAGAARAARRGPKPSRS